MAQRQTVCFSPINTATSYISWNDAEQAASIGAPCVSPHKPGSAADLEWIRHYNVAMRGLGISGFTQSGYRRQIATTPERTL